MYEKEKVAKHNDIFSFILTSKFSDICISDRQIQVFSAFPQASKVLKRYFPNVWHICFHLKHLLDDDTVQFAIDGLLPQKVWEKRFWLIATNRCNLHPSWLSFEIGFHYFHNFCSKESSHFTTCHAHRVYRPLSKCNWWYSCTQIIHFNSRRNSITFCVR